MFRARGAIQPTRRGLGSVGVKGLIPAGGAGTRLRPITHTSAKQLVPVANKPILFYGIEHMVEAGIREIGVILGHTGPEIRAAVGDGSRWGVEITYLEQGAPRGLADCVIVGSEWLGDDDFVMYLGDNMLEQGLVPFVERWRRVRSEADTPRLGETATSLPAAQILLAHVDEPRQFGVAELDADGRITALVEKPADPPSDLALVGVYLFDARIHEAVRSIEASGRGELEITDAIAWLLARGNGIDHEVLTGWWIDTGKKDPLLECNQLVLDLLHGEVRGEVDADSILEGRVAVAPGARIVASRVRGPVVIGDGAHVERSYVGPYSSIGDGCRIVDSELDHSVLLDRASVEGVARLTDSLIGRDSQVHRTATRPHALRLMLGDHSSVELPDGHR
jgi:glucose-1-phosphate thymidylyltransferase